MPPALSSYKGAILVRFGLIVDWLNAQRARLQYVTWGIIAQQPDKPHKVQFGIRPTPIHPFSASLCPTEPHPFLLSDFSVTLDSVCPPPTWAEHVRLTSPQKFEWSSRGYN